MGNGTRVATISIWTNVLNLSSDLCLNLDDCFCGLELMRTLVECQFYVGGTLSNGIYILDISNPILNVNDNKRPKGENLKSFYSWHYCLGHASKRCMIELHKSGSLGSFDCDSFDKSQM